MSIDNYCRLCALPRMRLLQIFEKEGFKLNIAESISKFLKIEICEKDDLPRAVCFECSEKLALTSKFVNATLEAQETLQRILNESRLLKKESCFVSEDGQSTNHAADSMVSNLQQENDIPIPSKILVSIDGMDSSFFDEYVDNLRSRNDDCLIEDHNFRHQMKRFGDSILATEYPESISDLIDSDSGENHTDEVCFESSKADKVRNCCISVQSDTDCLKVISGNNESIPESHVSDRLIKISGDIFVDRTEGESLDLSEKKDFGTPLCQIDGSEDVFGMRLRIKARTTLLKSPVGLKDSDIKNKEEEAEVKTLSGFRAKEGDSERYSSEGKEFSDEDSKGSCSSDFLWPCAHCDQLSRNYEDLCSHHSNSHKVPMKYKCPLCSKKFVKGSNFLGHLKKHKLSIDCSRSSLSKSRLSCPECDKEFSDSESLDIHLLSHADVRPFSCEVCGRNFRHQSALYLHARCHLPQDLKNKFHCDLCDKRFSTKPNLITHRRIHLGVRNFTCDQCGKSFIQKGNLDAHLLTHSSDKPFSCDICEKSFKTVMQLRKHDSIHTGAKPHQCDVCGRMFRERGTLREHYRIHTGAMPFSCEFCGKSFRFKGILTTHRRQHTGERPYSCQECQHHFTNWPNYNKHMKRRHGINTSKTSRIKTDPSTIYSESPQSDIAIKETESQDLQTADISDQETYVQSLATCMDNLTSEQDDVNDIILSSSNNFLNITSSISANSLNTSSYVHPFLNNPGSLINFYNFSHLNSSVTPLEPMSLGQNMVDLVHQQHR